jgi:dTDP-4-amino-4,6-dideoxygalactose transaminase
MGRNFPLVRPDVPKYRAWRRFIKKSFNAGVYSNCGPVWQQLSRETELMFPGRKTAGVANNTVGLIAVLLSLKVKNQNVILSNYTFAATLQAAILAGANPILCDVDPETWEISVETLDREIKRFGKPKVVIHTRVFGQRLPITHLAEYCKAQGIILIVDSAAAFPSPKFPVASLDALEVFSFHATKVMAIGEGGLLVGKLDEIEKALRATNFGITGKNSFSDGLNAKMDEFAAARALASLRSLESIRKKRENFVENAYFDLRDSAHLKRLSPAKNHLWSLFPVKFKHEADLELFKACCDNSGLQTKRYYSPSISLGYEGAVNLSRGTDLLVSNELAKTVLCLPVYSKYRNRELKKIRSIVQSAQNRLMESHSQ